jgi:predicted RNA-binding protein
MTQGVFIKICADSVRRKENLTMCLSTVYKGDPAASENILLEYVTEAKTNGDELTFRDITGDEISVTGRIEKIDLVKNYIIVQEV